VGCERPDATARSGVPLPDGLWQPAPGSTPPTGQFVYLNSDVGDFIGRVRPHVHAGDGHGYAVHNQGHLTVGSVARRLERRFPDDEHAQSGCNPATTLISCGNPFHNRPRVASAGPARGGAVIACWGGSPWNASSTNGVVTSLDLRFEQRCEGARRR